MFSAFKRPKTEPNNPGSKTEPEYGIKINRYGKKELVKTGETDVYALIQESLEETKIENIMARATAGDNSVLEKFAAAYADTTEMPKSLMDMQNMVIKGEQEFAKLPAEIKEKFNNSAMEFIAEMGEKTFLEKMGFVKKELEPLPHEVKEEKQEVKKDE